MATEVNEVQEQRDLQLSKISLRQLDDWLPRTERGGWTVEPRSPLAGDDRKSDPFHISHAVASTLLVAVDHAHALQRLMEGCTKCSPHEVTFLLNSYYSLMRGALENASRAVWLLAPDTRPERVLRRLRLQAGNVVNSDTAASVGGTSMPKPLAVRLDRIKEIAARTAVDEVQAVRPPGNREIVRAAGRYIGGKEETADHAEFLWRACSGAAHGDAWAGLSLHDKEILDRANGVVTTHMTASTRGVTTITTETFTVIDSAFWLLDLRNRPPY
jgi:hypothetical protein